MRDRSGNRLLAIDCDHTLPYESGGLEFLVADTQAWMPGQTVRVRNAQSLSKASCVAPISAGRQFPQAFPEQVTGRAARSETGILTPMDSYGKCALCLANDELVDRHLLPRALYRDLRTPQLPNPAPILGTPSETGPRQEQIKKSRSKHRSSASNAKTGSIETVRSGSWRTATGSEGRQSCTRGWKTPSRWKSTTAERSTQEETFRDSICGSSRTSGRVSFGGLRKVFGGFLESARLSSTSEFTLSHFVASYLMTEIFLAKRPSG